MRLNMKKEVAALEAMTVGELQERYVEVFGEPVRSRHKRYLIRRIAWRLQANAEGGLSERALQRAAELANVADVRTTPPKDHSHEATAIALPATQRRTLQTPVSSDPRLPAPGCQLTRKYKGQTLVVTVLADGFEYEGECYKSLTAVAKAITGSHISGFRFFKLDAGR